MNPVKLLLPALAVTLVVAYLPGSLTARQTDADIGSLVRGNSQFALDLYAELMKSEGNLVFSPYSVSTALAMTYAGARGNTALEMAEVLHFALDPEDLHPAFQEMETTMRAILERGDVELHVANSLWRQRNYPFLESFLSLTGAHYGASVTPVDFSRSPDEARRTINRWVEARTRERIRDLIRPGDLDPATVLALVNAIYFKGSWARRFDPAKTHEDRFLLPGGGTARVQMMEQQGDFMYGESEQAQVLELPYEGGDLSMFVILPREGHSLDDTESLLTRADVETWLSDLSQESVSVLLPKFRITWGARDLVDPLKLLGMRDPFLPGTADFSGMDGTRSLFLGLVLHKASIEVNEEGSEAAAATAGVLKKGLSGARLFRADRPFLFVIRENVSGNILFLGRMADPTVEGV